MSWGSFFLGAAAVPLGAALGCALIVGWGLMMRTLNDHGWTLQVKVRNLDRISDYTLRHNVWWERSWGPVFAGGWYREKPKLFPGSLEEYIDQRLIGRWIGFGQANGWCFIVIRTKALD